MSRVGWFTVYSLWVGGLFYTECKGDSDVRMPPRVGYTTTTTTTTRPTTIIYRPDSLVTLPCEASGSPPPTYEWVKNGMTFDLNQQNIHRDPDPKVGSLKMYSLTSLDEGYYQCRATNAYGTSVSKVFFLQQAVFTQVSSMAVREFTVDEGMPLRLPCHNVTSIPRPSYSWQIVKSPDDNVPWPVSQTTRVIVGEDGGLYFSHVKATDAYRASSGQQPWMYRCSVFNDFLDLTTYGSPSNFTVRQVSTTDRAPELMYSTPSPLVVMEESEFELQCIFSGMPEVKVYWELPPHIKEGYFGTRLYMRRIEQTEEFTCVGNNSAGSANATITVQVPSSFEVYPHDVTAVEGDTVSMDCRTHLPAHIQWSINGRPIDNDNPGPRTEVSNDGQRLTFYDLCRDCPGNRTDMKVVQCNASNVHGYVFAQGYINVVYWSLSHGEINLIAVAVGVGCAAIIAIIAVVIFVRSRSQTVKMNENTNTETVGGV